MSISSWCKGLDTSRVKKQVEKVEVGSKLVLKCNTNESISWFHLKYGLQQLPIKENTIFFKSVRLEDWGVYFCYGMFFKKRFFSTITVKVYGRTKIRYLVLLASSSLVLMCSICGHAMYNCIGFSLVP